MAIETGGQNQPQIQVNMSHNNTPPKKNSTKRPEGIDGSSQSTHNSPDQDVAHPPTQIGQSYGQPVQKLVIQSNQQQLIQNNGQPIQQNPILAPHAQMQVLQQAPQQQSLFHQPSQQQQQQQIVNQRLVGHNAFALQQQPFMFQQQMIAQQKIQQPQQQSIQPMYQTQQQVAMIQAPILYAAQPAAVVSNTALGTVAAPASTTNTPVQKAIKKGRFRVVKPCKQEPSETTGDGHSVVSSTSENPPDAAATSVTTKKKGRFIVRTKSIADSSGLSPTKEMVNDTEKSGADDALTKSGSLPPQLQLSSDKANGASNVKKKGRFRVKSGVSSADAETSSSSDKVGAHARRPSDDTKISSMGDVTTAEENVPSIASNTHVPGAATNVQVPQGVKPMSSNTIPQYTTFVPSMTSYDVNNQVMMVSAPFVTTQNTSMPMMQTSMQQPQMQQMYQNQLVQQQQQQQQQQQVPPAPKPGQEAHPPSHPLGLPLSNPNSPTPRTEPLQTQPQVPQLPQRSNSPIPKRPTASSAQAVTTSGSSSWRGVSGSQGKNGRLIGCGGVGKILHNLDCLRQEVLDADKCITSLQSDNRILRNKNKELEAKISSLEKRLVEEKSLRRSTDAKLQTLRQKVKELEPPVKSETQVGEEAATLPVDNKQVTKVVEEKSNASTAPAVTHTPSVTKTTSTEEIEVVLESKSQTLPPKKSSSLNQVEGEPKPKSPQPIRRALGSLSDFDVASLSKPQEITVKQFDPLATIAPAPQLCPPPTSSGVMAQNFQSLVDDNIAPIPMIVTTQMPTTPGDNGIGTKASASDSVQHFDPLGTPEKSQSQLNLQTLVINPVVPSVPTLTHLSGSPAIATATVPIYTLPIPTIQLPPQHQHVQPKQQEHDPFDDIICRNQNAEQNGNGHHDSIR